MDNKNTNSESFEQIIYTMVDMETSSLQAE